MLIAGLFDINDRATDKPILSFSIVTTEANQLVEKIHPRMPVILDPEKAKEWLNPDNNGETDKLKQLLLPYPEDLMESWAVSKLINNYRNEGKDVIKPLGQS
jgi:putative SOS response-associated peptidase YedK